MMNSTNSAMNSLLRQMKSSYPSAKITIIQNHEMAIDLEEREIPSALSLIKNMGFAQLSIISCVDWIAENRLQLVFNVFNWQTGLRVLFRTLIDREQAKFNTVTGIYPNAKYYEREIHEFFGIVFEGNDEAQKPLFLENWDDIPPYRKDFNSKEYSDRKYSKRSYEKTFGEPGGEPIERI